MARSKVTDVPMALAVKIELFKRGCFDFITVKDGLKHEKQDYIFYRIFFVDKGRLCISF